MDVIIKNKRKVAKENARPRGGNFSAEEELSLAEIIAAQNLIENKTTNAVSPQEKEAAWEQVYIQYNNCNKPRSVEQLKSKYDNLKTAARKYAAERRNYMKGTGGGPAQSIDKKSIIYDVILKCINLKTVTGLSNNYDEDCSSAFAEVVRDREENIQVAQPTSLEPEIIIIPPPPKEVPTLEIISMVEPTANNNVAPVDAPLIVLPPSTISNSTLVEATGNTLLNWANYTPQMLKKQKNAKLQVQNDNKKSMYTLKEQYIKKKILFLEKEDERQTKRLQMDEEYHAKKMALIQLEIDLKNENLCK